MRRVLRVTAKVVGTLAALLAVIVLVMYAVGSRRLEAKHQPPDAVVAATSDSAAIARGEHLSRILSCHICHGQRLEGQLFVDIPPARAVGSNLTPGKGGVGATYSGGDWDRAVRYGIKHDGRMLLPFMPSRSYNRLNERDAHALASYLEALPPVDNELPRTQAKFIGKVVFGMRNMLPKKRATPIPTVEPAETAEYGAYLASVTCTHCHGNRLQGGKAPDPNAPPAIGLSHTTSWSPEQFATAMRTGQTPQRQLTEHMPWKSYRHMNDQELAALREHIRTVQPN